eukprot:UN00374
MAERPEYENKFDFDDEPAQWVREAQRHGDSGSIHFGPDPRFVSSMDQTRWCFVLFNNYLRCVEKLGEDAPRCQYLHHKYRAITPIFIQDAWKEQVDDGKFGGFQPGYEKPQIVVDYSLKPSKTRHLEEHH